MKFYQVSRRSRAVQTGTFTLFIASVVFHVSRSHRYLPLFPLVLVLLGFHSLWNRYWEITPDHRLVSKAWGFKQSFSAASILYAGPAREADEFFFSKNDIELVMEGFSRKQYVRLVDRQEFIDELSRVSPQAEIIKL